MTPKQERAIEQLKVDIFANDSNHHDGYEFKKFDVEELDWGNMVSLITEVGLVNDAGTLASIFARTRRHILIGPRGGLTLLNSGKFVRGKIVPAKTETRGQKVTWGLTA